jgi:hypothetical protein
MHPMATSRARHPLLPALALALAVALGATLPLVTAPVVDAGGPPGAVRVATFNASLNRAAAGVALSDLSAPFDAAEPDAALRLRRNQAANVAEVVQRVRPEVLLINEFDYVDGPVDGNAMTDAFQANYLGVPQNIGGPGGATEPISYPYVFVAPSNTGIASGFDLNNNGAIVTTPGAPGYGDDAFGFGNFPGQFGMAVFSQHPIDHEAARTFQTFLWKDMPGALFPDDTATSAPADWYSAAELAVFRLSSNDRHRRHDRALLGEPSDPTGLRRRGGPQRATQPRRDPLLGGLHHARRWRLHL